jgi:mono/diheme cytochrome c family protein
MRGAQIFASDRAQCATCHEPENGFTDNKAHVLGFGEVSVTPSLLGTGKRARLFHDGRYASFEALLDQKGDELFQTMGGITKLAPDERQDLAAYLRTL